MRTVEDLLGEVPALTPLSAEHRALVAGCGRNRVFEPGSLLMREGEPAQAFHVIRAGSVAIQTFVPKRGEVTIETLHEGDLVGWSWLVPPYRGGFDARAIDTTHAIEIDGACLRGKFDRDAALGYELLSLFAPVIVERLQQTRMRLLDVYGKVPRDPLAGP
jgi:CRP-like cAMP-binding protein